MATANKQIFFWYGDNDFEIHEQIVKWRNAFEKKHGGINVQAFDFLANKNSESFLVDLKSAFQVDSLFGSYKFLILKDFLVINKKEKAVKVPKKSKKNETLTPVDLVLQSLEKLPADLFVVFWQKEKPDTRLTAYKKIQELAKKDLLEIKEFVLPRGNDWLRWLQARIKMLGLDFAPEALNLFSALVTGDPWQSAMDMEKLAHYGAGRKIESADVNLLVKGKFNDDIFALTDALAVKNKKKIFKLLSDQLMSGANELYLLTMLTRQFRLLWQIKEASAGGRANASSIASELGLHPFVVQKTLPSVGAYELAEIKHIYKSLLDIEIKLKTGKADFETLFGLLIAELK